ncbi:MAG: response regulator [Candidatus Omnitrophica bacterium]|nr:response regulator [Candidatus Omnitrophota bacterium]MBL7151494.1 response regulator [Candidatus Omnitrophota bacterium]
MSHKLLVVDDERDIADTLAKTLTREGYETVVAYDGEEALQKLKAENPDIIILDLIMPKLNGFDVLKEVREKYKDKWRPVIIVSAKSDLESVKKGYGLEADHYLTKPCSVENILRGIRIMISLMSARIKEE